MAYGYSLLRGRQGAEGHIRETGEGRTAHVRGVKPGEKCALYALQAGTARLWDEKRADGEGRARLRAAGPGNLFVACEGGVRLWEGGEDTLLRASAFLTKQRTPEKKTEEETKEEARPAVPPPEETEDTEKETEQEEMAALLRAAQTPAREAAEKKESSEKTEETAAWSLRPPGEGEGVDALPDLVWPGKARDVKPYFDAYPPAAPVSAPGWRFVRVPGTVQGAPDCFVGRRVRDGRVTEIAYLIPRDRRDPPPAGYSLLQGGDGREYFALTVETETE